MIELDNVSKEFLLQYFFNNLQYAGWKNIATKLLETGECVVGGDNCIWIGGVGNFIKTSAADEGYFGCLKYVFDFETFLTSEYYLEIRANYLIEVDKTIEELKLKRISIANIK